VQVAWSIQRRPGTRTHRGAGIRSNQIDAQSGDDGAGVVFVQTVEGKAVVEESRRLEEYLTSHLGVHVRSRLDNCLRGRQELVEWRVHLVEWHVGSISGWPGA
jgi:hypothetical protein